jgi:hypothetical protein
VSRSSPESPPELSPEPRASRGGDALALLPGRAVLRTGGRLLEQAEGEGWAGALASLGRLLAQARPAGPLAGVLSHHFARSFLVPPPPVRLSAQEMAGWLPDCLARDYGAEAAGWELAWQDAAPGRPVPVAALDRERLARLQARLAQDGLGLKSLEPWFASAWNRHRAALGRQSGWFALLEPGRMALARVAAGRPVALRTQQCAGAPAEELQAMIRRETLHGGFAETGPVWVVAVAVALPVAGDLAGRPVHVLSPAGAGAGAMLP